MKKLVASVLFVLAMGVILVAGSTAKANAEAMGSSSVHGASDLAAPHGSELAPFVEWYVYKRTRLGGPWIYHGSYSTSEQAEVVEAQLIHAGWDARIVRVGR